MAEKMTTEIKLAIQKGFVDASTTVNKHTAEVIGNELGGAIEDAKKLTGAMLSPLAAAFKKDDVPKEDKERNSLLTEMVDYFGKQEAAAGRKFDPKEKKSPWYKLLIGVGLIVGGIAGAILLPFTLLWKGLKAIKPIAVFFGKIGLFIKGTKMFTYFDDLMKWFKKLPILGRFISAFKTGFKFLAWPIQVILMAIDFIKGFAGTEGDIIAKIKGGLLSVIKGFIELPVKLFGWIADWFLGIFDIKVKGGSAKVMMDNVMQFAGIFIDNIIGFLTAIWDGMKFIWKLIGPTVIEIVKDFVVDIGIIVDTLSAAWDTFKPWMQGKLLWIGSFFTDKVKPMLIAFWDLITNPIKIIEGTVNWMKGLFQKGGELGGKMVEKVKNVFVELGNAIINWILDLFPPKLKNWIAKKIGIKQPENEPTKQIDSIITGRKTTAATYATRQATKEEMAMKAQKETTKELARGNIATMKTAAAITNNNKVEYVTEPIADETDNKLIGFAMMSD
jgi:hypothetical protein